MKSSLSTYKNYLKKNLIKFDPNQELAMIAIDQFLSNEFSLKPIRKTANLIRNVDFFEKISKISSEILL